MDSLPKFLNGEPGIARAAELLRAGACVAAPTETVYGLAADAFYKPAVRSIFAIKNRPFIDPLIVHVAESDQLSELTTLNLSQQAAVARLTEQFWPGPLTLVLPKRPEVLDLVTANRDSVAVRCPAHPVMHSLLVQSGLFLAAPSANPFGYISPTTAQHVRDSLGARCPYILDGGPCERGVESTIVDLRDPLNPQLLRPGPIGREELKDALGRTVNLPPLQSDPSLAPGMLERHYSPSTRLQLCQIGEMPRQSDDVEARIFLKRPAEKLRQHDYWLSETGDLNEVAANLFNLLRMLDAMSELNLIHCELPVAGPGVADAIRDRLQRASKR